MTRTFSVDVLNNEAIAQGGLYCAEAIGPMAWHEQGCSDCVIWG
jgi:hypothetical protein